MTNTRFWSGLALTCAAVCALALAGAAAGPVRAADKAIAPAPDWDRQAAARYLDGREAWWQGWDRAQKDRGTLCISCHTQAPYGLARPVLRQDLGEAGPAPSERVMLASIEKRVRTWAQMQPFYSDVISGAGKEIESRNAESVLNAVILESYDARAGHLGDTARIAFDNAWTLQSKTGPDAGAWVWQNFGYGPWEAKESQYHWAALMAVAVGKAPDRYRDDPKIAADLSALIGYLHSHYADQPLLNKLVALWASAAFPAVLDPADRAKLLDELARRQHADGGWSTAELGLWARRDNTPEETRSDGYATALITLVLEETSPDPHPKPIVARGVAWLTANQDKTTGAWTAWSLNKARDPKSDPAQPFMTDAATGYAVLALEARR